ncbi:hypothetical protein HJG60_012081 [Phyllostomus discolor]|uniref:Uncharacterized protein n=1 Tax=Phyllostomus discolor TaxID=89673 RepID=A0A833ZJR0_9CHIR|nr:hypothetical protein HJG60_012081 [Phyllostomus discolor]
MATNFQGRVWTHLRGALPAYTCTPFPRLNPSKTCPSFTNGETEASSQIPLYVKKSSGWRSGSRVPLCMELPEAAQHFLSLASLCCLLSISTMAFQEQLILLLWNNFLHRQRQPVNAWAFGTKWVQPRHTPHLTLRHYPACSVSPRSSSRWSCCGLSPSWWPSAIHTTPHWGAIKVNP